MAAPGRRPWLLYNPFDPAMRSDPYPAYRRLRETAPVHHSPLGFWVVSGYDDVVALQRDPRLSLLSPAMGSVIERLGEGEEDVPMAAVARQWLLLSDPDQHRRFRGALGRVLAPRALEARLPTIRRIAGQLLAALPDAGELDLVRDLARPLPIRVLTGLLDLPEAHLADYTRWAVALERVLESVVDLATIHELSGTIVECERHLRGVVAARRRAPGDDLLSALLETAPDGQPVSDEEAVAHVSLTLGAAAGTTANLIGNAVLALLRHPDQLDELRRDRGLLPNAIEELLRFEPPAQLHARWTPCDVEVGGTVIPGGSKLVLLIGAANRDPRRFPDPDRLDLRRAGVHSAAFGGGAHYCLGAGFARLEGRVALELLLERYPGPMQIVDGPNWREEHVALRSLRSLVVRVAAGAAGPG